MDIKKQEKQINLNITIPPHKFHKYNEYIEQTLTKYENKSYNNDCGYIFQILSIDNVEVGNIIKNSFSGNINMNVKFTVECYVPYVGEIIKCKIIQNNKINIGQNGPLKMIIIDEDINFNIDDIIDVQILCFEICKDMIKVVCTHN